GEHPGDEDALTFEDSHGGVVRPVCYWGRRVRRVAGGRGRSVAHAEAAVDGDDGAGDVAAAGSGEEADGLGDVLGGAETAQGNVLLDLRLAVLGQGRGHVGLDEPGGDDVHGDVA